MNDGRKLLWQEGRDEQGPYQSPMEDGMVHFHEFLRRELEFADGDGSDASASKVSR